MCSKGKIQRRVKELLVDIVEQYDITIDELEVSPAKERWVI
jgi:hypothetical protein